MHIILDIQILVAYTSCIMKFNFTGETMTKKMKVRSHFDCSIAILKDAIGKAETETGKKELTKLLTILAETNESDKPEKLLNFINKLSRKKLIEALTEIEEARIDELDAYAEHEMLAGRPSEFDRTITFNNEDLPY